MLRRFFFPVLVSSLTCFVCVCVLFSERLAGSSRLFPEQPMDGYDQRAEVLYDGRWGSICDVGWDTEDGTVVCNALGDGGTAQVVESPSFRQV